MGQNEPKQPQQQQPQQPQKGQGPQQQRGAKKALLDQTNLIGGAIWLTSGMISAVAIANTAVSVPALCRGADGFIIPDCVTPLVTTSVFGWIILFALILQLIFTAARRRIRHPMWSPIMRACEIGINLFGFYWLFCVRIGLFPDLRLIAHAIAQLGVLGIIGFVLLLAVSYGIDKLSDVFFDAPASGRR